MSQDGPLATGRLTGGFDVRQTDRLLTTTRAVRMRLDLERPVEPDVIVDCLRIASQAPSGANAQRWRWLVVTDPERRRTIATYYQQAFAEYMAPRRRLVGPDDTASMRMIDSASYLAEHLGEVPVLVIPCGLERVETASVHDQAAFYGSVLPAVWSFQLALRSRGIGSAWTTLHLHHEREVADLLGIPETVTQVALLPVAYFTGDGFRPAARRSIHEITYWDAWRAVRPGPGR